MDDRPTTVPPRVAEIDRRATEMGVDGTCDARVGALLRTLAATVGGGRILELGTGIGMSTAWMLDGMDAGAHLVTVELDAELSHAAQQALGRDPRVTYLIGDGTAILRELSVAEPFDLIFADTWPGKYWDLDLALGLLAPGGLYVIDDMLSQPNWPDGHGSRVADLLTQPDGRPELIVSRASWASGVVVAARR